MEENAKAFHEKYLRHVMVVFNLKPSLTSTNLKKNHFGGIIIMFLFSGKMKVILSVLGNQY